MRSSRSACPWAAAITAGELEVFARERRIRYDSGEDEHYDTISAFIKSCRGSDPDAAMFWLAKMLAGGEDPRFIARRLVILASEDVGLADPLALPLAVAAHHACDFVGLPEAELTLAHATLHIATAPKSNSATLALDAAHAALEEPVQPVPPPLRDKSGAASKRPATAKAIFTRTIIRRTSPVRITWQNRSRSTRRRQRVPSQPSGSGSSGGVR